MIDRIICKIDNCSFDIPTYFDEFSTYVTYEL